MSEHRIKTMDFDEFQSVLVLKLPVDVETAVRVKDNEILVGNHRIDVTG